MSPRVLLVDDETNIRKMVGALLESEGFETAEAANGNAALAAVEREAPDAVLLDLMMPGGPDGSRRCARRSSWGARSPKTGGCTRRWGTPTRSWGRAEPWRSCAP